MKVLTPKFRVSYPNVFTAKLNPLSKKEEFSLVALFPKDADLSALKKAAEDAAIAKWGSDPAKRPKKLRSPFRTEKEDGTAPSGMEDGGCFMNFKSKDRPGLIDQRKQEIIDTSDFYAGCWARASVNAYAYDQGGNRGVAFGLNNLQKVSDGDSLSGRTKPEEDFEAIEGASSAESIFN